MTTWRERAEAIKVVRESVTNMRLESAEAIVDALIAAGWQPPCGR